MKKKYVFLMLFLIMISMVGCQKKGYNNIIKDLDKKIQKANSYKLTGVLEITNNEDTYQYDVEVSFKKDDNYRVSLINKSNNHEQIILKNSEGVFVKTQESTKQKLNVI